MEVLSNHGASVIPANTQDNEQVIYVNHSKVLLRKSHTPNDSVCVELFHEGQRNVWVKSWGITSDAQWLLHVDHLNVHWWFNLPALKEYISNGIANGSLELRNNSQRTRNVHGVSSNVMSVWINKFNECDCLYNGQQDYSLFLAGVNGVQV